MFVGRRRFRGLVNCKSRCTIVKLYFIGAPAMIPNIEDAGGNERAVSKRSRKPWATPCVILSEAPRSFVEAKTPYPIAEGPPTSSFHS